jgi:hypothetical protein
VKNSFARIVLEITFASVLILLFLALPSMRTYAATQSMLAALTVNWCRIQTALINSVSAAARLIQSEVCDTA